MKKEAINNPRNEERNSVFSDIKYICKSTELITKSLERGCDVVQMPNGDVIITEVKALHTLYSWNNSRGKMVKTLRKAE